MTSPGSRFAVASVLAAILPACAQPQPPAAAPSAPPAPATCDAAPARFAVGHVIGEALMDEMRRRSGAARVRVVRPGMAVTMEFNAERLTVNVDDAGRVTSVACG